MKGKWAPKSKGTETTENDTSNKRKKQRTYTVVRGADGEDAADRGDNPSAGDPEGQRHGGVEVRRLHEAAEDECKRGHIANGLVHQCACGNGRPGIGFEEVSTHSRDVADVVTDVGRNHRRIAGIVLIQRRLDLAHEIGTDACTARSNNSKHVCE